MLIKCRRHVIISTYADRTIQVKSTTLPFCMFRYMTHVTILMGAENAFSLYFHAEPSALCQGLLQANMLEIWCKVLPSCDGCHESPKAGIGTQYLLTHMHTCMCVRVCVCVCVCVCVVCIHITYIYLYVCVRECDTCACVVTTLGQSLNIYVFVCIWSLEFIIVWINSHRLLDTFKTKVIKVS